MRTRILKADCQTDQTAITRRSARDCLSWTLVGLALALVAGGFLGADRWFYEHVSQRLNTEEHPLDNDFYALTKPFWLICRYAFGHVLGGVVIYVAVVLLHRRSWSAANAGLVAVLLASLAVNLAKPAVGRLRPNQSTTHLAFTQPALGLARGENVSFPSGEAATAFALACVLRRLFPRWTGLFLVSALLAAGSRLVNGAHYLSDVGAGALLGLLIAQGVMSLAARYWTGPARPEDGAVST